MHIVITGASSGIGAAYARTFAAAGHTLTLVARRRDLLDKLATELPTRTFILERDLSKLDAVAEVVALAEKELGPIDVLVNNAGVQVVGPTATLDVAECERMLDVDLKAPLRLTLAALPGMLARGHGTIVDVASMAALAPTPGMTYYNAAKAGLAAASESLRGELRHTGVHVVTVYPGIIASTAMAQASMQKYEESKIMPYLGGNETVLAALTLRAIVTRKFACHLPTLRRARAHVPGLHALAHGPHHPRLPRRSLEPGARAAGLSARRPARPRRSRALDRPRVRGARGGRGRIFASSIRADASALATARRSCCSRDSRTGTAACGGRARPAPRPSVYWRRCARVTHAIAHGTSARGRGRSTSCSRTLRCCIRARGASSRRRRRPHRSVATRGSAVSRRVSRRVVVTPNGA